MEPLDSNDPVEIEKEVAQVIAAEPTGGCVKDLPARDQIRADLFCVNAPTGQARQCQ